MKVLIFKFDTILSKETTENIENKLTRSLNNGVFVLDNACSYEVVEFDGMERG